MIFCMRDETFIERFLPVVAVFVLSQALYNTYVWNDGPSEFKL